LTAISRDIIGISKEILMTDVLIRNVPDDALAAIEARARRLGLSRSEYLRREVVRTAAGSAEPVTVESLRMVGEMLEDLADDDVMRRAWE